MEHRLPNYPEGFYKVVKQGVMDVSTSLGVVDLSITEKKQPDKKRCNENVGMVVFMGTEINGAFAVHCNQAYLDLTNPIKTQLQDRHDWLVEIANRMAGAIRSNCHQLKIDFEMSVPLLTQWTEFAIAADTIGPIEGFVFSNDTSHLTIEFCCAIKHSTKFEGNPDENLIIGGPGEALIFEVKR